MKIMTDTAGVFTFLTPTYALQEGLFWLGSTLSSSDA